MPTTTMLSMTNEAITEMCDTAKQATILGLLEHGETELTEELADKYVMVWVTKRTFASRIMKLFDFSKEKSEHAIGYFKLLKMP